MNTLIVYAGKTGTTEKCAKILGNKLDNVTIVNIGEQDIDISNYDLVIIGSSIRIGMFHKKVKKFITNNNDKLINKKVAYFICCGFSDSSKEYFERNLPKELLEKAIIYDTFGGEMDINKQRGIEKFIVRIVTKTEKGKGEIKILQDNIDKFIETLNKAKQS